MSLLLALEFKLVWVDPWWYASLPVAAVVCAVTAVAVIVWHKLVAKRSGPLPRFFWLMLGSSLGLAALFLLLLSLQG